MTQDKIIKLPNPHLRQRSVKVGLVTDHIRQIIGDMESATIGWDKSRQHEVGVALAAVQIDQLYRIIIVRKQFEKNSPVEFTAYINPEIVRRSGEIVEDYEGCLSIKNIYGKIPRHSKVKVRALGVDGKELRVSADGFLARVFQHEIDHMNGVLFIDHIKDEPEAFYHLEEDGKLIPLNFEKDIKNSSELWG